MTIKKYEELVSELKKRGYGEYSSGEKYQCYWYKLHIYSFGPEPFKRNGYFIKFQFRRTTISGVDFVYLNVYIRSERSFEDYAELIIPFENLSVDDIEKKAASFYEWFEKNFKEL